MFVVNFKLDLKKLFIFLLIIAAIIALIIEFGFSNNGSFPTSKSLEKFDYVLEEKNYTEVLKTIHENIDANVNKTVKFSGYIFRMPDFKSDYFVCGKNIILNNEDNLAGFLCQSKDASNFKDNEWVEITGVVIKGFYNADMPVIKVKTITKIEAPANSFVNNT